MTEVQEMNLLERTAKAYVQKLESEISKEANYYENYMEIVREINRIKKYISRSWQNCYYEVMVLLELSELKKRYVEKYFKK